MHKLLAKTHQNKIGSLKINDNTYTDTENDILNVLASTHFPGSKVSGVQVNDDLNNKQDYKITNLNESENIFTEEAIKWAINDFEPFKAAGKDEIFPALLQNGLTFLSRPLKNIFIKSHAMGYIPKIWNEVKVIFIPKAGRRPSEDPKSYRPISLSSVMLKIMEKILDRHIRENILKANPLSRHQYAYQTGKSTEAALKTLVEKIKKSFNDKQVCLGGFLDIMGAFDHTSFESICRNLYRKGVDANTCKWVKSMLTERNITMTLGNESISIKVEKGTPQGSVISPLLWCLVVDELIIELNHLPGIYAQGYADDIVILCISNDCKVNQGLKKTSLVSNTMQIALNKTEMWCKKENLLVNPDKTSMIMFTKKHEDSSNFNKNKMFGKELSFVNEVKYLGVILDRKLTWNIHLDRQIERATNSLWICRKLLGKQWGLKPKLALWIYTAMVRPIISYASIVWWEKAMQTTAQSKLNQLQRLACLTTLGGTNSKPILAMELLLDLPPLHLFIQNTAMSALSRYKISNIQVIRNIDDRNLFSKYKNNSDIITAINNPDHMIKEFNFNFPFEVDFPSREDWENIVCEDSDDREIWYTDGSLTSNGTGCGIYSKKDDTKVSISMEDFNSVFQAEVFAIQKCTSILLQKNTTNKKVIIHSDSQAALKAIRSNVITSKVVKETVNGLKNLSANNKVNLRWIPAHSGYEGNEIADECAKKGTLTRMKRSRNIKVGAPLSRIKECLKKDMYKRASDNWHTSKIRLIHSRDFIVDYNTKRSKELLSLSRKKTSLLADFLTGHAPTRYMLSKKRLYNGNTSCRFCEETEETAHHLLCDCVRFSALRRLHINSDPGIVYPYDYYLTDIKNIFKFVKELKVS
jgi:ribonuclease HI